MPGEGLTRPTDDLERFFYFAKRVAVFLRSETLDVGFSFWSGFRIKTRDKAYPFILEHGRKTLKPHKAAIRQFLQGP